MNGSRRLALIAGFIGVSLLLAFSGPTSAGSVPPVAAVNTSDGIALKGYDPVAYFTENQPTRGLDEYVYRYNGVTYRFVSAQNLKRFRADPDKYLPQYGGYCAYAMSLDRIADIDPKRWTIVDGKLYLNNGYFSQTLWSLSRSGKIVAADRNWPLYPKKASGQ
jgi:YHS domain-containing protein